VVSSFGIIMLLPSVTSGVQRESRFSSGLHLLPDLLRERGRDQEAAVGADAFVAIGGGRVADLVAGDVAQPGHVIGDIAAVVVEHRLGEGAERTKALAGVVGARLGGNGAAAAGGGGIAVLRLGVGAAALALRGQQLQRLDALVELLELGGIGLDLVGLFVGELLAGFGAQAEGVDSAALISTTRASRSASTGASIRNTLSGISPAAANAARREVDDNSFMSPRRAFFIDMEKGPSKGWAVSRPAGMSAHARAKRGASLRRVSGSRAGILELGLRL
jgi:hypothetical protein